MLVTNIEEAEQIVRRNKDLRWDGWNIVSWYKDPKGFFNKNGKFINNQWGIQYTYELSNKGWNLPNKYKVDNYG